MERQSDSTLRLQPAWHESPQLRATRGNSQSKINFVVEQDPLTVQKAYTTVDASIGFSDQSERYRLSFFVRNLFDEHYVTLLARSTTLSTATVTPNQLTGNIPKEANRYFGATLGISF